MNIFILSPETSWAKHLDQQVQFLVDRHVVKMIAESVQMLVTAAVAAPCDLPTTAPCQPLSTSMAKHPCTQWTAQDPINFNYLAVLALAMCYEHQHRYPLSRQHAYMSWLQDVVESLSRTGYGLHATMPKLFAVAVKDHAQRSVNTPLHHAVAIYRDYYVRDKHKFATWKRRAKPLWFLMAEEELIAQGRL